MNKTIIVHVKENPINGNIGANINGTYFFFSDKEHHEIYNALKMAETFTPALPAIPDNVQEFLEGIVGKKMDWSLLRKQKKLLAQVAMSDKGSIITDDQRNMAEGLLNLLDFIMDGAVDTFGLTSKEVFNKNYPSMKGQGGKSENEHVRRVFNEYLCEASDNYGSIVSALRKALQENPNLLIDDVRYIDTVGDEQTLTVWEKFEFALTVREFCKIADID